MSGNDHELPKETAEELYENAPCGYLSTLPDGRIFRVNKTFLEQTGYDSYDLISKKKFQELLTIPGRVFFDTHFAPLLRIRGFVREISCDLVRPGQGPLPVLVNAVQIKDDSGEPSAIRYMVFEATERRRYERDLLEARRRIEHLAAIVESSADAIISVGPKGTIRSWNQGASQMFEKKAEEAIGKAVSDLIHFPDDVNITKLIPRLLSGESIRGETRLTLVDSGSQIEVAATLTPHIEPPAELTAVSAFIRDVTDQKRAEESIRKQEMLKNLIKIQEDERHRIARDLHDHLGQQATGIRLGLIGLGDLCTDNVELKEKVGQVEMQLLQMDHDISFLAFELRPNVLVHTDLAEALQLYTDQWSRNYKIDSDFHRTGILNRRLLQDIEVNLYRVVQEALNNAAKHARPRHVSITLDVGASEVRLVVEDDGVGFDTDHVGNEPADGTHGFGLLGMRDRAALLGGSLEIESEIGAGTAVFARVPAAFIEAD